MVNYKNCEYYINNNYIYLCGNINGILFFWRLKINGIMFNIFQKTGELNQIIKNGKFNDSLVQKYIKCKEDKKRGVKNQYIHKYEYDKIRKEYNNGATITYLKNKYGGCRRSIFNIVNNLSYKENMKV